MTKPEGVAAPLEPSVEQFIDEFTKDCEGLTEVDKVLMAEIAQRWAAAVSKNETLIKQEWRDLCKRNEENCFKALARIRELEKEITALTLSRKEDAEWINKKAQAKGCFEIVAYSAGMLLRGEITALRKTK